MQFISAGRKRAAQPFRTFGGFGLFDGAKIAGRSAGPALPSDLSRRETDTEAR